MKNSILKIKKEKKAWFTYALTLNQSFIARSFDEKKSTRFAKTKLVQGFTLIETLVAIMILVIAIIGPMEIASKGLFSAFYARDQITAYYLAQEGVEYVKNKRYESVIAKDHGNTSSGWLDLKTECSGDDGCIVDPVQDTVEACQTSGCPKLNYYDEGGFFMYENIGIESHFIRTIKITPELSNPNEFLVQSEVKWNVGSLFSSTKTFVLQERMFDW